MAQEILQSQGFKLKLSESVGVDWLILGRWLNIKDTCLNMIDQDNTKTVEKAYSMLTKWVQMKNNPNLEELKTALQNMNRKDLVREVDVLSNTSNSPEMAKGLSIKKDISEIRTALKNYYLGNYEKINELQPLLKADANVDLINKFINLCIIDSASYQKDVFNNERSMFLKKQMCYESIPYDEIFTKENPVILISGIAGVGKTWLLRKCLLDWSKDLIWKNVDLVFYLECRRLNQHENISCINELLNVFYKDIITELNINNHTALFIIDGLDEFKYLNELINPSLNCNYSIVNVLEEIRKYKYVVAGRVYAIDQYQGIPTDHNDKLTIQIMGFNENGINNYIDTNVVDEKKEIVKEIFKESPIAKSMASVPFYLSSMCKIIVESKQRDFSFLTMTDLYANIFLYFLHKHIIKNNGLVYKMMENEKNKKYILNICKIAYELFIQNKFIFFKEEVLLFINDFNEIEEKLLGFIEKIETHLGCHYQFAHLTIMEFCASVYAYNNFTGKEIMANKKLESCLSMILGLTNKSQNNFIKFLVDLNNSNKEKISMIHICYLLHELNNDFKSGIKLFKKFLLLSINNEPLYMLHKRDSRDKRDSRKNVHDYTSLFIECFYESQSYFTNNIKLIDKLWWEKLCTRKMTSYEISCLNYFVNHFINSGRKLKLLFMPARLSLNEEEKNLIIKCLTNVRHLIFLNTAICDNAIAVSKFNAYIEGWKPKDKIEKLFILIDRNDKEDFMEIFLPWINLCERLYLFLNEDVSFIENIIKCISCSNIRKLRICYRRKKFHSLNKLKMFIKYQKTD